MKSILFFSIFCGSLLIGGCNKHVMSNEDHSQPKVIFSNDVIINGKVLAFFDSYFSDAILNNVNDFFLLTFRTDTTIKVDLSVANNYIYSKGAKPYALIRFKERNIFAIHFNDILIPKKGDKLLALFDKRMQAINDNNVSNYQKHWLLVIDNLTNESKIITDELDIISTILGVHVIDSPYKFSLETNEIDTIL